MTHRSHLVSNSEHHLCCIRPICKGPMWTEFHSPSLRDSKWRVGKSLRRVATWVLLMRPFRSHLLLAGQPPRRPRRAPFALCELAFYCSRTNWLQGGRFLQSIWNGSDFLLPFICGNQLYMDAWKMLQGLEDERDRIAYKPGHVTKSKRRK